MSQGCRAHASERLLVLQFLVCTLLFFGGETLALAGDGTSPCTALDNCTMAHAQAVCRARDERWGECSKHASYCDVPAAGSVWACYNTEYPFYPAGHLEYKFTTPPR